MQLFYRKYGNGIPIIALHGLYASYDNWIGLARELSGQYQLILPDLRNHGRSAHSTNHSYTAMSNDLLELLDELAIDKAILMGHSMGGKVAMYFALNHSDRVRGLVVEDISPLAYLPESKNAIFHQNIIRALKNLPIDKTRKEIQNILYQKLPDRALSQFLLKNLQRAKNGTLQWRINLDILAENLPNIMDGIVTEGTIPFNAPSLFIKGSTSAYITEKDEKAIREFFPHSAISSIDDGGHTPHNEQEREFVLLVKQYLSLLNSTD